MKNRNLNTLIAVGLAIATIAVATPALADNSGTLPSGCSFSLSAPYIGDKTGHIFYQGGGTCSSATSMQVRLVHNYASLPDVRVAYATSYGGPNFYAAGYTCDNGGTTQYYDENAFTFSNGKSAQRVSATKTLSHC